MFFGNTPPWVHTYRLLFFNYYCIFLYSYNINICIVPYIKTRGGVYFHINLYFPFLVTLCYLVEENMIEFSSDRWWVHVIVDFLYNNVLGF